MAAVADASVPGFNQSLKVSRQVRQHQHGHDQIRTGDRDLRFPALPGADGHAFVLGAAPAPTVPAPRSPRRSIAGSGVNQSAASLVAGTWTSASSPINGLTQALTTSDDALPVQRRRALQSDAARACFSRSRRAEPQAPTTRYRSTACSSRSARAPRRSSASTRRSCLSSASATPGRSRNRRRAWSSARAPTPAPRRSSSTSPTPVQMLKAPTVTVARVRSRPCRPASPPRRRFRQAPTHTAKRNFHQRQFGGNGRPGHAAARRRRLGVDHRQRGFLTPRPNLPPLSRRLK